MKTIRFSLLLLAAPLALTTHAQSHAPSSSRHDNATVTFYTQTNFRGESLTLPVGERWDDLNHVRLPGGRAANNRFSSVRIPPGTEVTLFDFRSYQGESITLTQSVANLEWVPQDRKGDWNNALSSVSVRSTVRPRGPAHPAPGDMGRHDRDRAQPRPDTRRPTASDRATIQIVRLAYQDVLGRAPDPEGLANYVEILQTRGWSESRLRRELQNSTEYRRVVIPGLVQEAYQDVLQRQPDSAGLRFYTDRMIHHGWTEERVRDALRQSPEYRKAQPRLASRPAPSRGRG